LGVTDVTTVVIRAGLASTAVLAGWLGLQGVALADTDVTFGVGLQLQSKSNPNLTPGGSSQKTTGGLTLSLDLLSQTPLSTLSLQASGKAVDLSKSGTVSGLIDPSVSLSYARTTANAQLTLDAGLTDVDVGSGAVTDFDTGTGKRRTANISTGVSFGTAGPLGFGLTAGVTDTQYHDNPAAGLTDSQTRTFGASLRADLSPVLHLNLGLKNRQFEKAGAATRDTRTLDLGLTLDRPTGTLALNLRRDDTPNGQRLGLSFQHDLTLPSGTLSYALGATRGVTDKTFATASLSYARTLANGSVQLSLSRAVQPGAQTDTETLISSTSLSYSRAVTANANLGLSLNWAAQHSTATNLTTANTNLSATWSQTLPQNWALDLGYIHRLRDQDGVGKAQSDTISLSLRRTFVRRF
jgi:hypothetical protein